MFYNMIASTFLSFTPPLYTGPWIGSLLLIYECCCSCLKGTPFDFRQDKQIYTDMHNVPNGYDINYLLDGPLSDDTGLRTAAM